jgi:protein-disulfide isomerase
MTDKPKTSSKAGVQTRNQLRARQAALEAERKRNQAILLTVGALAVLVIVILVIVLSSRPAEAEVDLAALSKKLDGLTSGTTKDGQYPLIFPTLGNPDAPVRMEEISSFACPACKSYHDQVITNIFDKIKSGDLYYVYFPTTRTGDYTEAGKYLVTYAGYCAMQQNKFWQMHEVLFDWQGRYGAATPDRGRIQAGAEKLGMDMGKFNTCLDSKEAKDYVDASDKYVSDIRKMASTPSIFIYEKGVQIKPPTQQSNTPDSLNSLSIAEIRGIIEKNSATKPS